MLHVLARCISPELAHSAAVKMIRSGLIKLPVAKQEPALKVSAMGMEFRSPVGLAAGFDKNAECIAKVADSAFGFAEFGTVTALPQDGNPRPRLFRYPRQRALVNRLGFNGKGAAYFANNVKYAPDAAACFPYGINIGKNASTTDGIADYANLFSKFYNMCGYIAINISSPNTQYLRNMQNRHELDDLLSALSAVRTRYVTESGSYRPYLLKISPDINRQQMADIADLAFKYRVDGLILTNTTTSRRVGDNFTDGGLSGSPLFFASNAILREFYLMTEGKLLLVGVGGVMSAADAYMKIKLGASLVQLYTGLVYKGFGLIGEINAGLASMLARDGYSNVSDAVGSAASI